MVVLVTGGSGFVGGRLAHTLLARGDSVRLLVRERDKVTELEELGAEIVVGDLLQPDSLKAAVKGCAIVHHVAARMMKPGVRRAEYLRSNVEATRNLVTAAIEASVPRFVYASTAGVYGMLRQPVDETGERSLSSAYRESKGLAEDVVLEAHRDRGFPGVVARLSPMIGPRSTNYLGLARGIARGGFRGVGNLRNHDHITPVEDVVEGLRLCGVTPGIEGRTYVIAGDTRTTTGEIIGMFAEALGAPPVAGRLPSWPYRAYTHLCDQAYLALRWQLPFAYRYAFFLADKTLINTRAKAELGFSPRASLQESIVATVKQYRQDGLL